MKQQKWFSSILLSAIVLTAVVGVCAKTGMADVNATGIFTNHQMDMVDCAAHPRACDSAFANHMRLLSQTLPSLIQDLFTFLTLGILLIAVVVAARAEFIKDRVYQVRNAIAYRIPPPIPLLTFLFRKGILNPKRIPCSA